MTTRRLLYPALLLFALAACPVPIAHAEDAPAPEDKPAADASPKRGLVGADPVAEAEADGEDDPADGAADGDGAGARAFMGVGLRPVAGSTGRAIGLPERVGLQVAQVVPGSSADKGGIEVGDVLHKFDDQLIITAQQFSVLVSLKSAGDTVKLTYYHKQKKRVIDLKLGERPKPAEQANAGGDADGPRANALRLGAGGFVPPQLTDEERRQLEAGGPVVRRFGDGNGATIRLQLGEAGDDAEESRRVITDDEGNVVGEVRVIRSVTIDGAPLDDE